MVEWLKYQGLVTHICICELHGSSVVWGLGSNHCYFIFIGILKNSFHWNLNQNTKYSLKNMHLKIPARISTIIQTSLCWIVWPTIPNICGGLVKIHFVPVQCLFSISGISIALQSFSFMKMHLQASSAKCVILFSLLCVSHHGLVTPYDRPYGVIELCAHWFK